MKNLGDIYTTKKEHAILDVLMPGGVNWELFVNEEDGDCLNDCPFYSKDKEICHGPYRTECTVNWAKTEANVRTLKVMSHVLHHFEYYNRNDISIKRNNLASSLVNIKRKTTDILESLETNQKGIESYALKMQRSNQYEFRKNLIDYWQGCAVTGIKDDVFLVASHIVPWSQCSKYDKMNKYNGLLLLAPIDFLFDNYHLSFDDKGNGILTSAGKKVAHAFGITPKIKLTKIDKKHLPFLRKHRKQLMKINS